MRGLCPDVEPCTYEMSVGVVWGERRLSYRSSVSFSALEDSGRAWLCTLNPVLARVASSPSPPHALVLLAEE